MVVRPARNGAALGCNEKRLPGDLADAALAWRSRVALEPVAWAADPLAIPRPGFCGRRPRVARAEVPELALRQPRDRAALDSGVPLVRLVGRLDLWLSADRRLEPDARAPMPAGTGPGPRPPAGAACIRRPAFLVSPGPGGRGVCLRATCVERARAARRHES